MSQNKNLLTTTKGTGLALKNVSRSLKITNKLLADCESLSKEDWDWWNNLSNRWKVILLTHIYHPNEINNFGIIDFEDQEFSNTCLIGEYAEGKINQKNDLIKIKNIEILLVKNKYLPLDNIDAVLNKLKKLEILYLNNKRLEFTQNFGANIRRLKLDNCSGIDSFLHTYVPLMPILKELSIPNNNLRNEDITALSLTQHLERLDLSHNGYLEHIDCISQNKNLKSLNISHTSIKNIKFLINFPNLTELKIDYVDLSGIKVLNSLKQLEVLHLRNNTSKAFNLKNISSLIFLKSLYLTRLPIKNVHLIENFVDIVDLDLDSTGISEISFLSNMRKLRKLYVNFNKLENINYLRNKYHLETLYACFNRISEVTVLENCPRLIKLNLSHNNIENVKFLEKNILRLEELKISNNKIKDLPKFPMGTIIKHLDFSQNEIEDISNLVNIEGLISIDLGDNLIKDISVLENFQELEVLKLNNNKISNLDRIYNLKNLKQLDISGNRIKDISVLKNLQNISSLNVSNNINIDINPIVQLEELDDLKISGCALSDEQVEFLKTLPKKINIYPIRFSRIQYLPFSDHWRLAEIINSLAEDMGDENQAKNLGDKNHDDTIPF